MPGSWGPNLQNNLNIDKQIIYNLAHLLYCKRNRSCYGHPSCDLSQDRELSGLHPSSLSILGSDHTRDVHTEIYSLHKSMVSKGSKVRSDRRPEKGGGERERGGRGRRPGVNSHGQH